MQISEEMESKLFLKIVETNNYFFTEIVVKVIKMLSFEKSTRLPFVVS